MRLQNIIDSIGPAIDRKIDALIADCEAPQIVEKVVELKPSDDNYWGLRMRAQCEDMHQEDYFYRQRQRVNAMGQAAYFGNPAGTQNASAGAYRNGMGLAGLIY